MTLGLFGKLGALCVTGCAAGFEDDPDEELELPLDEVDCWLEEVEVEEGGVDVCGARALACASAASCS